MRAGCGGVGCHSLEPHDSLRSRRSQLSYGSNQSLRPSVSLGSRGTLVPLTPLPALGSIIPLGSGRSEGSRHPLQSRPSGRPRDLRGRTRGTRGSCGPCPARLSRGTRDLRGGSRPSCRSLDALRSFHTPRTCGSLNPLKPSYALESGWTLKTLGTLNALNALRHRVTLFVGIVSV
jgi:hypothetical protein